MAARLSKLSLGGASMVWLTDAFFLRKPTFLLRAERLIPTFPELCGMVALTPLGCTRVNANAAKPHLPLFQSVLILLLRFRAQKHSEAYACFCAQKRCAKPSTTDGSL